MSKVDVSQLVDNKTGRQSRTIFHEQDIYEQEQERIFGKCWLFLAHESQIPDPGDYFRTFMGEDEVLVIRQKDQSIKAFLNTCTHRGNRVCKSDKGNAKQFTCSYHGWSFAADGALQSVPLEEDAYYNELDKSKFGLHPVCHVDSYKGLIFGNFDPEAPSLVDYLGDMKWYLDVWLDAMPEGTELIGSTQKVEYPVNWKLPVENACGDGYHIGWAHAGVMTVATSMNIESLSLGNTKVDSSTAMAGGGMNGHSIISSLDGQSGYAFYPDPSLPVSYLEANRDTVVSRLGDTRGKQFWGSQINMTIFPNVQMLPGLNWFRVYHPKGPGKMEMWTWAMVDKEMSDELKQTVLDNVCRTFGAAGMFDNDDGENFAACTSQNRGLQTRQKDVYTNMALGKEYTHPEMPGVISDGLVGEQNQRYFYRRWQEMMAAKDWSAVPNYNNLEEANATEGKIDE
jgi:ethylbenzene dioxygenase subunit alpha